MNMVDGIVLIVMVTLFVEGKTGAITNIIKALKEKKR